MRRAIEDSRFPWESSPILKGDFPQMAPEDNVQWVHGLYLWRAGREYRSPYLPLIAPVLARFEPFRLIKAKLNRTRGRDRHVEYGMHVDTRRPGAITAVFYLNDNDGYTIFEDGTRVPSLANRLVIFDAHRQHTGASCTDAPDRLVLNINLLPADGVAREHYFR